MNRRVCGLIGLLVIALIVGGAVYITRGREIKGAEEVVVEEPAPLPQPEPPAAPTPPIPAQPQPTPADETGVIKITAEKLCSEFEENPVAAREKYKDRILEVTGVITGITDFGFGAGILVEFKVDKSGDYRDVVFRFGENQRKAVARLKKGQTVTIRGELSLFRSRMWSVELTNSTLVK